MNIPKRLQKIFGKFKSRSKTTDKKSTLKNSIRIEGNVRKSAIIIGDGNIICHIHLLEGPGREEQLSSALSLADLFGLNNLSTVEPDGSASSLTVERQAELLRQYRQQLGLTDKVMGGKTAMSQRPHAYLYRCPRQELHSLEIIFDDKAPFCSVCHATCMAV